MRETSIVTQSFIPKRHEDVHVFIAHRCQKKFSNRRRERAKKGRKMTSPAPFLPDTSSHRLYRRSIAILVYLLLFSFFSFVVHVCFGICYTTSFHSHSFVLSLSLWRSYYMPSVISPCKRHCRLYFFFSRSNPPDGKSGRTESHLLVQSANKIPTRFNALLRNDGKIKSRWGFGVRNTCRSHAQWLDNTTAQFGYGFLSFFFFFFFSSWLCWPSNGWNNKKTFFIIYFFFQL